MKIHLPSRPSRPIDRPLTGYAWSSLIRFIRIRRERMKMKTNQQINEMISLSKNVLAIENALR